MVIHLTSGKKRMQNWVSHMNRPFYDHHELQLWWTGSIIVVTSGNACIASISRLTRSGNRLYKITINYTEIHRIFNRMLQPFPPSYMGSQGRSSLSLFLMLFLFLRSRACFCNVVETSLNSFSRVNLWGKFYLSTPVKDLACVLC